MIETLREPPPVLLSPEEVRRRRKAAESMLAQGTDTSPVEHWTQGAARVAQALAGVYEDRKATKAEETGRAAARESLKGILTSQPGEDPQQRIASLLAAADDPWLGEGQRAGITSMIGKLAQDPRESQLLDLELEERKKKNALIGQKDPSEFEQKWQFLEQRGINPLDVLKPSGTTVNVGGDNSFEKGVGEAQAKQFIGMVEGGINSKSDMADIAKLRDLTATNQGGLVTGLTQLASEYGIKLEGADRLEAASAIINRLVPAQRTPGSGPMSDRDVELFKSSLPKLVNTPRGNKTILDTMEGLARYKAAQAEIANAVVNGAMDRKQGSAALMALPNPLEMFRARQPQAQQQVQPPAQPSQQPQPQPRGLLRPPRPAQVQPRSQMQAAPPPRQAPARAQPAAALQQSIPEETKTINGKTYIRINGRWYEP
jgi:hypothetical protein